MEASGSEQPEVAAIMEWSLATGFVASASMHEVGAGDWCSWGPRGALTMPLWAAC